MLIEKINLLMLVVTTIPDFINGVMNGEFMMNYLFQKIQGKSILLYMQKLFKSIIIFFC